MITGITVNGKDYVFPADCAFSSGQSATTRDTRAYDYTKTSQAITRVLRGQPVTYSATFNLTSLETDDLYSAQVEYDALVGKHGDLVYSGYPMGDVFIIDASFAIKTDSVTGVVALSITLNMRENRVPTPITDAKVVM